MYELIKTVMLILLIIPPLCYIYMEVKNLKLEVVLFLIIGTICFTFFCLLTYFELSIFHFMDSYFFSLYIRLSIFIDTYVFNLTELALIIMWLKYLNISFIQFYLFLVLILYLLCLTIWTRAAGPRVRLDQLAAFVFKNSVPILIGLTIIIIIIYLILK